MSGEALLIRILTHGLRVSHHGGGHTPAPVTQAELLLVILAGFLTLAALAATIALLTWRRVTR